MLLLAVLEFVDYLAVAAIAALVVGGARALQPSDQARLRRVENKLDLLLRHLNIEAPAAAVAGLSEEVCRLADEGKKIEAIARHREQTGTGLREAKDAVEAYMNRPA